MTYDKLLESKIKVAEKHGIKINADELHESTKPHQADTILWALELGRALLALECGMGKSHIQIEILRMLKKHIGGTSIIVTELGVTQEFCDPEIGEGARLGVRCEYITHMSDVTDEDVIYITNYERIRNGDIDLSQFDFVSLDEGSYLKNMASETTDSLHKQLATVKFKFIATATPSPNETLELINYSHVLGVTDRGQILTRFFQRNSVKAGELTLHPQHTDDFWLWVSSWALFITQPSDLGHSDEGYALPELNVHWHEVKIDHAVEGGIDRDGQTKMFRVSSSSLQDAAKIKRESIGVRLEKALDMMFGLESDNNEHYILWHNLEDERKAINISLKRHPSYGDIYGSQQWNIREKRVIDFSKGTLQILATKPEISGVGCNFQKHCNKAIFLGIDYSFEIFYQAMRRIYRFGQTKPVDIHIIYTPEEYEIVNVLKEKWELHNEQRNKMREIVMKYGLNHSRYIEEKRRSFKMDRRVWKGEKYELINNDCVYEFQNVEDNRFGLILSSFPFGNHYEYTDKYNDFGHNTTNEDFLNQLDFLLPHLYRSLKPGRIAAIHLKNRIHYGSVTGKGFSTFHRFTHKVCDAMEKHKFDCIGFHYINTDVVSENKQTYRLGWTEMCKDSTKMGAGIPEEIWLFRKPPTSNADAYADEPVMHSKDRYSRGRWQVDAAAHWRSNGNRFPTLKELQQWGLDKIMAWWKQYNASEIYDYEKHIEFSEMLESIKKLSAQFMTLAPVSTSPYVWDDVNRMHGLNMEQSRRKQQNHICPMPFDEVDRLIELYSNPDDEVADPFAGLCTTGVRAVKKGRRAFVTELNDTYAKCGALYLKEAEMKNNAPTLFDVITEEKLTA
jgi:DNA modification methylase